MVCRGIRGATTVTSDDREMILQATRELLALVIRLNDVKSAGCRQRDIYHDP